MVMFVSPDTSRGDGFIDVELHQMAQANHLLHEVVWFHIDSIRIRVIRRKRQEVRT
jgi:hypothetical protein